VTNNPRRGQHRFKLFRQRMYQIIPEQTQIHAFWFRRCTRVSLQRSDQFTSGSGGRMEEEPPSWLISSLYLHGPGLTFVTHATACVPSACVPSIWKLLVLPKELRIRHIIHMSFGIILNYYSQGLSPLGLTLSPFSHLPAPNPLPSLWMLSPPSLIHRVGLHVAMFIFY
jgi:hypothetical protein